MKELELETAKTRTSTETENATGYSKVSGYHKLPKLPNFNPQIDELDAYINRFESLATQAKWSDSEKYTALSNLLTGDTLQVLYNLPSDEKNYVSLKNALFIRYRYTEYGFRERFRKYKPTEGLDFKTFVNSSRTFLNKYIESAKVQKGNFDQLVDLIMKEQIYNVCNDRLVTFLKERNPQDINELIKVAELFTEAHPSVKLAKPETFASANVPKYNYSERTNQQQNLNQNYNWQPRYQNKQQPRGQNGQFRERNSNWNPQYRNHRSRDRERYNQNNRGYNRNENQNGSNRQERNTNVNQRNFRENRSQSVPNYNRRQINMTNGDDVVNMEMKQGFLNNQKVNYVRDTGAGITAVKTKWVLPEQFLGENMTTTMIDGTKITNPLAIVSIETEEYTGLIKAIAIKNCCLDLVLGNNVLEGYAYTVNKETGKDDDSDDSENPTEGNTQLSAPMQTRAQTRNSNQTKPTTQNSGNQNSNASTSSKTENSKENKKKPDYQNDKEDDKDTNKRHNHGSFESFDKSNLINLQKNDKSLSKLFYFAEIGHNGYLIEEDILKRKFKTNNTIKTSIVAPSCWRSRLLKLAHDSVFAGHLGIATTKKNLLSEFTWPNVTKDITSYVKSCHICQKKSKRPTKIPLGKMEPISTPFQKVAIDIIGPLPTTKKGNSYILSMIDVSSRWPECIPLPNVKTETIAQSLFEIFSRLGIPNQILSDNAKQLISESMQETYRLLGIQQRLSAPLHPISHGIVERLNQTIQKILDKLKEDSDFDWDELLPAALFAIRNMKNSSTGFAPTELMLGRKVRGPMDIIADLCLDRSTNKEIVNAYSYAEKLKKIIKKTNMIASQNAEQSAAKNKRYYDLHAHPRYFNKNEQVLVLLPQKGNSLYMAYQGPYKIIKRKGDNYYIQIGKQLRVYHANLLKRYFEREEDTVYTCTAGYITEEISEDKRQPDIQFYQHTATQNFRNAKLDEDLNPMQRVEIRNILEKHSDVLTDVPGKTDILEHEIRLTDNQPFRVTQYPIPFRAKDAVEKELKTMLEQDIIRHSSSPYCSPITIVNKPDGSIRLCIDFRKLNSITLFDNEPIPQLDEIMTRLNKAKYFSKLDLSKGYFQVPLKEECKQFTAFKTSMGLMEFNYLPFGLSTAAPTFQRAMYKALHHLPFVASYFDDILIFSDSWEEHLKHIDSTLEALSKAHFTVKPTKCILGSREINFLGHIVSQGIIKPDPQKTDKILNLERPKTKKDVRKICGVLNYYRKFVPFFSELLEPLTNLTKKSEPTYINWTPECEIAFTRIKHAMASQPILILPDLNEEFIVRTDASSKAIGAVLMQKKDNILRPIYYVSRKLLDRERNYPICEKEALAIVFAFHMFSRYLFWSKFKLQCDSKCLSVIKQNKTVNPRILRWSLAIQGFNFDWEHISGQNNRISDVLSRF